MSKKPIEISDTELMARDLHSKSLLSFMSWDDISAASRQEFINDVLRGVKAPVKTVKAPAPPVVAPVEVVTKAPKIVTKAVEVVEVMVPAKAPKVTKVTKIAKEPKTVKKTKKAKTVKIDPSLSDDEKKALRKKLRVRKQIAKNKKSKKLAAIKG